MIIPGFRLYKRVFSKNKYTTLYKKYTYRHIASLACVPVQHPTGEILVALVTASGLENYMHGDLSLWTWLELQHLVLEGRITGFLHIINNGLGDVVKK